MVPRLLLAISRAASSVMPYPEKPGVPLHPLHELLQGVVLQKLHDAEAAP
jgi:hypothetical protein